VGCVDGENCGLGGRCKAFDNGHRCSPGISISNALPLRVALMGGLDWVVGTGSEPAPTHNSASCPEWVCFQRKSVDMTGIFYPLIIQLSYNHHPDFERGPYEQARHQKSQRFE